MCDCEQQNNQEPVLEQPKSGKKTNTTRRKILKAAGVATIGGVASIAFPSIGMFAADGVSAIAPSDLEKVIQICNSSDLFVEVIDEIRKKGFNFTISPLNAKLVDNKGDFWGVIFESDVSPSPRTGVCLFATVHLAKSEFIYAQYVTGMCMVDTFWGYGISYDSRHPKHEIQRGARETKVKKEYARFYETNEWRIAQPDSRPLRPEEFVKEGWPPETVETCYWHFAGCTQAIWQTGGGRPVYQCAQLIEHKSCKPEVVRYLDCIYPK